MRPTIIFTILFLSLASTILGQENTPPDREKKHGFVWSAGVFKSWLYDKSVAFDKIGDTVTPVFTEEKKSGFSFQSHYMYQVKNWFGAGVHLGVGFDVYSNIKSPVLLFGGSISFGKDHQFIIDFGWADGERKLIPTELKYELMNQTYTEIPELYEHTAYNTGLYLGMGYRIF